MQMRNIITIVMDVESGGITTIIVTALADASG